MAESSTPTTPVPAEERGTLEVRTRAIEQIIGQVVLDLESTVSHRSSLTSLKGSYPQVAVTVHGAWARATVTVAAEWPCPVSALAGQVRDAVIARTPAMAGIDIRTADVTVHLVDEVSGAGRSARRVE